MTCLQEDCANWDGDGYPCRVLDLEPVDVRAAFHDWDDEDDEIGCDHDWLDRPESDTHVCRACGEEDTGPPPSAYRYPPGTRTDDTEEGACS